MYQVQVYGRPPHRVAESRGPRPEATSASTRTPPASGPSARPMRGAVRSGTVMGFSYHSAAGVASVGLAVYVPMGGGRALAIGAETPSFVGVGRLGLIRFCLAALVVASHNSLAVGISAHSAVVAFFIISGFVICMAVVERYDNPIDFYIARYLRLWPTYIVVAGAVLLFVLPMWQFSDWSETLSFFIHLSSITLFGTDVQWWVGVKKGTEGFVWLNNAFGENGFSPAAYGSRMPHMWSIGIEIWFYMLAPFIARKPRIIIAIFIGVYLLHVLVSVGLHPLHPLRYRSILNFMWLFLAGMLSFHAYLIMKDRYSQYFGLSYLLGIVGAAAFIAVLWGANAAETATRNGLLADPLYLLMAASIGPIFHATGRLKIDRGIGDVSYPLYVVHWPIVAYLLSGHRGEWLYTIFLIALSTAAAAFLHYALERNVDKLRKRYRRPAELSIMVRRQEG